MSLPPESQSGHTLILACSPRKGGNTDTAASVLAGVLSEAGMEQGVRLLFLRDFRTFPCIACGSCSRVAGDASRKDNPDPGRWDPAFGCPLSGKDDAAALFHSLLAAARVYVVSPIYFYHLPAAFKALIDRTQAFYALREARNTVLHALPVRSCHTVLIAGRPKGRLLFQGSILTLKYAMELMRLSLPKPLLLRGLDGPDDFSASGRAMKAVAAYARTTALEKAL